MPTTSNSNNAIVQVRGVHKYFRRGSERLDVLNGVSLEELGRRLRQCDAQMPIVKKTGKPVALSGSEGQ